MAYARYFFENIDSGDAVKCTCTTMCPKEEVELRIREHLVHALETVNGTQKLVKEFCRSAANCPMTPPSLLRPFQVLRETVEYLLLEVTSRTDVSDTMMYDFIDNRLRAVRQDATIQRLLPAQMRALLEPMIRFYIYYGYLLCEEPQSVYDPTLNRTFLLQCFHLYFANCDVYKHNVEDLTHLIKGLQVRGRDKLKDDRVLVEVLYLLSTLEKIEPLNRYLTLPKNMRSRPSLSLAFEIALSVCNGNFARATRLSRQLTGLPHCAFALYLPLMQRRAVQVLSRAYSSPARLAVPLAALVRWLRLEDRDVITFCHHYKLELDQSAAAVRFRSADAAQLPRPAPPRRLVEADNNLDLTPKYIFTYSTVT